ncbi:transmembrane 9 superfamily member 5-like [Gastrolobium bilobum]|uniref:transmembrane 9 superfamily member 5-like n=1 Tax=Gastrolobium bilobum TaxID=150636 RepID=UPI002AB2EAD5|nr:transmembrane 9 superfamily member 5-like [Gastrolobium bilobum]
MSIEYLPRPVGINPNPNTPLIAIWFPCLICSFLFLSYQGALYPCNAKAVSTYILAAYGLTSAAAGYVATAFHGDFSPIGWKACIFQTGALYSLPSTLTFLLLYTLEGNTSGFPDLLYPGARNFLLQSVLFAITQLGTGGIIGHFVTPRVDQPPCAITRSQRHISGQPWYSRTTAQMFFGGLLPFTAIFWMMDDIYASLWNIKVCGAFSTMISAFVVVVSLTVLFAMAFTRYQLSKQDHDWRWRSLLRGGSPAIFMFVYGIYFHARISGDDFMNMVFVMGYNACIFYAFFLVLGTIGYFASSVVFQHMYRDQQKND